MPRRHLFPVPAGSGYVSEMHASPETWHGAVELYKAVMHGANRADSTIRLHVHYLFQLQKRFRRPWQVSYEQLIEVLSTPSWGADARKSARSVYRGFYGWGLKRGLIDVNPAADLEPVSVPHPVPHPTPEILVHELLNHPKRRIVFMGMLAAFLGLRCMEIAVVHSDDWNRQSRRLIVHGKGGKTRVARVYNPVLRAMLDEVDGWAFPSRQTGSHLTSGYVSKLLSEAQLGHWTAHPLRHRAASIAYEATGDIYAVRDMLGHVSVATTEIYTATSDRRVDAALEAASDVRLTA